MALVTAAEVKASRQAGGRLTTTPDADVTRAISIAEAVLYSDAALGYAVQTSLTTVRAWQREDTIILPQRARTVSDVSGSTSWTIAAGGFKLRPSTRFFWQYEPVYVYDGSIDVDVTGTFGYDTTDPQYLLAQEAVTILAVDYLRGTEQVQGLPVSPPGAYLTGYASESAQFSFFTPQGQFGRPEVDRLINQIGRHPFKNASVYTVPVT